MTILETHRLRLRPLHLGDAPRIQRYFAQWDIVKHLSNRVPWPYPEGAAEAFVLHRLTEIEQSKDESWAITEKTNDGLIGLIDYFHEGRGDAGHRGFWLGQPWQGNGYMTEAVCAVHDYLFDVCHVRRLTFENATNNPASRRIKEKTGARWTGRVSAAYVDGWTEGETWELTAEDWRRNRS